MLAVSVIYATVHLCFWKSHDTDLNWPKMGFFKTYFVIVEYRENTTSDQVVTIP